MKKTEYMDAKKKMKVLDKATRNLKSMKNILNSKRKGKHVNIQIAKRLRIPNKIYITFIENIFCA